MIKKEKNSTMATVAIVTVTTWVVLIVIKTKGGLWLSFIPRHFKFIPYSRPKKKTVNGFYGKHALNFKAQKLNLHKLSTNTKL